VRGITVRSAARTSAGKSGGDAAARRFPWITPLTAVITVATLLALGLRIYLLSRPGYLLGVTEYDDGPYFGSAVRLVDGVLPYRSFILVQPPGITLLMTPAALMAKVIGTAGGMVIGRILTMLASAAAVVLGGLLVRHRGLVAVTVCCGIIAVYPDSVLTARTVLVEPWLVLFCLAGALAVFDGDRPTDSRRRLLWGGVAFGFAGAVEAWAIAPVLVVIGLLLGLRVFKRAALYLGGVAAGFLVPVVPFAALAPRGFYDSLVTAQIGPRKDVSRASLQYRLQQITGLFTTHGASHALVEGVVIGVICLVLGCMVCASLLTRRPPPPLEWFGVVTSVLVMVMFLWPPQFHYHFPTFLAPFLALAVALPLARFVTAVRQTGDRQGKGALLRWGEAVVAGLAVVVLVVFSVFAFQMVGHLKAKSYQEVVAARRLIPPGSCLFTDTVAFAIMTNRFVSKVPGCSVMDDGLGTDLALSHGLSPSTGAANVPAVEAVWWNGFRNAQFVWLSRYRGRRIAWTPELRSYLNNHFVIVLSYGQQGRLFERKSLVHKS
jgi:hypothetical protein